MTGQSGQAGGAQLAGSPGVIVTVVASLVFEPLVLTLAAGHRPGLVTLPGEGR
jgi:hypothetical protein